MTSENDSQQNRKRFAFAPQGNGGSDEPVNRILKNAQRRRNIGFALTISVGIAVVGLVLISLVSDPSIKLQVSDKQPQTGGAPQIIQAPQIDQAATLKLQGLTYKGITSDGKNFIVLADSAHESQDRPNLVDLESPRAQVDSDVDDPITLKANQGQFDRQNQRIALDGRVVIVRPDIGYTLRTEAVIADLSNGKITSDQRIDGFSSGNRIGSEGVVIDNEGQNDFTAHAELITYDLNTEQAILRGNTPTAQNGDDRITAHDRIIYDRTARLITATGRVEVVLSNGQILRGETITATLNNNENDIVSITANANAEMHSPEFSGISEAFADAMTYDKSTGIAILTGSVTIKDGSQNEINGDRAQIDTVNGLSTMSSSASGGRVGGVFQPPQPSQ